MCNCGEDGDKCAHKIAQDRIDYRRSLGLPESIGYGAGGANHDYSNIEHCIVAAYAQEERTKKMVDRAILCAKIGMVSSAIGAVLSIFLWCAENIV